MGEIADPIERDLVDPRWAGIWTNLDFPVRLVNVGQSASDGGEVTPTERP